MKGGDARRVYNLHVAVLVLALDFLRRWEMVRMVVAQLQEAFDAAARVFGALAVVPVGERHDEASTLKPLALTGGDELVNNALCVVREVAELCLPHRE